MTNDLVSKTVAYLKANSNPGDSGHDWWHLYRVWQLAKAISAHEEKIDLEIVELAALLHDVPDYKFHDGDKHKGEAHVISVMQELGYSQDLIAKLLPIITNISYLGAGVPDTQTTLEGKIVQDADRLDAIGAIGVARCFAWGGKTGSSMYEPTEKPGFHQTEDEYKTARPSSINHFYEKLLLLKDRMNTKTGKLMAESRHKYLEDFLQEFYAEWEGQK